MCQYIVIIVVQYPEMLEEQEFKALFTVFFHLFVLKVIFCPV